MARFPWQVWWRQAIRGRWKRVALGVAGGVALAFGAASACSSAPLRTPRAPAPGQPVLVVMTYNLNYGLAGDPETLSAIGIDAADLVLLQETTPEWELAIRERFGARYPHMAFRHCCLAGGLGVLSSHPFEELGLLEPPADGWFPAWLLRVESPLGPLQVLNVHLRPQIGDSGPNAVGVLSGMVTTPPVRRAEIDRYVAYLKPDMAALIAGDFNESERGGAVESLGARGFRSALPEFSEERTWRWHSSVGELSRRFDHIAYSRELDALSARVVEIGRSDHFPVVAVIGRR